MPGGGKGVFGPLVGSVTLDGHRSLSLQLVTCNLFLLASW